MYMAIGEISMAIYLALILSESTSLTIKIKLLSDVSNFIPMPYQGIEEKVNGIHRKTCASVAHTTCSMIVLIIQLSGLL